MEKLIPVVNRLQDVFSTLGTQPLDLPQIAVVGAQSAGKSSVLETLVGRDFLPRGNDIVTRRPLILQLFNHPATQDQIKKKRSEWGEFLHLGNKKMYDFEAIRDEIERETERVAPKQAIDDKPINLRIYSPDVLNLTIIDLPGMTKVAVGNQPSDISKRIRDLLLKFITKKNCLILAVTAANGDLANSDALALAREVDPPGHRTLGVLTKIDLMDKGTNAMDYLTGKVIPLRLGYVGVVNRSQQDILDGKTIRRAQKDEARFFAGHPAYRTISNQLGSAYLGDQLNRILINHIKDCLPKIKQEIYRQAEELKSELTSYGQPLKPNQQSEQGFLLRILSRYATSFCDAIDGKAVKEDMYTEDLFGGARILHIFRVAFAGSVAAIGAFDGLKDSQIRTSIRNASGAKPCLFVPEVAFELLVKGQIEKLRRPSTACVELVLEELKKIASAAEGEHLARFDTLRTQVQDITSSFLRRRSEECQTFLSKLIDIELSYINTNHPDFISGQRAVTKVEKDPNRMPRGAGTVQAAEQKSSGFGQWGADEKQNDRMRLPSKLEAGGSSEREVIEISLIKILIESYFNIVKKTILDRIPKSIMSLLVSSATANLQEELILKCYENPQSKEWVRENPEITIKRETCQRLLETMEESIKIVNSVRDFKA